jgi:hypothetical protein
LQGWKAFTKMKPYRFTNHDQVDYP